MPNSAKSLSAIFLRSCAFSGSSVDLAASAWASAYLASAEASFSRVGRAVALLAQLGDLGRELVGDGVFASLAGGAAYGFQVLDAVGETGCIRGLGTSPPTMGRTPGGF